MWYCFLDPVRTLCHHSPFCSLLLQFSVTIHPQCSRWSEVIKCPNCLIRTVYGSHFFPLVLPQFSQPPMLRSAKRARGENSSRRLRGRSTPELTEIPSEYASPFGLFHVSPNPPNISGLVITLQFYSWRFTHWWRLYARPSRRFCLIDYAHEMRRTECEGNSERALIILIATIPNERCKTKVFDKWDRGRRKRGRLALSNWPNVLACHAIW